MAGSAARVRGPAEAVWEPAKRAADADEPPVLEEIMRADGVNGPLEPWDLALLRREAPPRRA